MLLRTIQSFHTLMKERTDKYASIPADKWKNRHLVAFFAGHLTLLAAVMLLVAARAIYQKIASPAS